MVETQSFVYQILEDQTFMMKKELATLSIVLLKRCAAFVESKQSLMLDIALGAGYQCILGVLVH